VAIKDRAEELRQVAVVEVATDLYARDRDAFATVVGSAMAMRLFLFVVPANIALIALTRLLNVDSGLGTTLASSITTGQLPSSFDTVSFWASLWTFVSSMVLTLWAGRSLARILATASTSAWQMPPRHAKLRIKTVLALSTLLFLLIAVSDALNRMRELDSLALTAASWVGVLAAASGCWLIVALSLPRPTRDPGSVLPGVILVGVGFTVLQWFMQFYLPRKVEESTDRLGDLATTVAALSYFFLIGRLVASGFVLSAITFERWGSVSAQLFGLPVIRRIPKRYPAVQRFFALPPEP
jgi:uncharacterized BrkB/YihY/UPF0761 family membrane protein